MFCRLDLEAAVPDHSTFSKNRHGRVRESDAFRHVFESVLRRCMSEGLVGGEGDQANEYRCPQGHALLSDRRQFTKPRDRITKAGTIIYSASEHDCAGCPMKQQCCTNVSHRKITRSVHERSRDVAREIANTPQ